MTHKPSFKSGDVGQDRCATIGGGGMFVVERVYGRVMCELCTRRRVDSIDHAAGLQRQGGSGQNATIVDCRSPLPSYGTQTAGSDRAGAPLA